MFVHAHDFRIPGGSPGEAHAGKIHELMGPHRRRRAPPGGNAAERTARSVQTCDAFGIPPVTLVDVPVLLPGRGREHGGIIRRARRQAALRVLQRHRAAHPGHSPQGVRRFVHRMSYAVIDSRSVGADPCFARPADEIAVMAAEGAAGVVSCREIAAAADPDAARAERVRQYREELLHPYYAAQRGLVDDVIDPAGAGALAGHAPGRELLHARPQARQPAGARRHPAGATAPSEATSERADHPMTLHDPGSGAIDLRIVRGAPDGDEIAAATVALLAVLRLRATQDASPAGPRTPGWTQPHGYGPPGAWATT